MSTDYNVTIEYDTRDDIDDDLIDAFTAYHPATGRSQYGKVLLIITVPAADVVQILQTAAALIGQQHHAPVLSVEVLPTDEFDRRSERPQIAPDMLSVTQAADLLGVTRQAVLQRLESGSIAGMKVGSTWNVFRASLGVDGPRRISG